ncbi:hypothetical protein JKP88DRAFT_279443 [Tribonema minus]|uniref:Chitin-binding type-1 domain-containing protein n=1 Tax=Tribonema minus TaxID=303371 RepID=A0A835YTT5_9STRA|nr:hypothetical protein JKP88DRAFT_279443 [Tribonema minus]
MPSPRALMPPHQRSLRGMDAAAAAADADAEFVRRLTSGDAGIDALAELERAGGEFDEFTGSVLMPSGRRLDAGSVVRVLWAYTPRVETLAGGAARVATIINGAFTSANQVLTNSGLPFILEAAYFKVSYTESTASDGHSGALTAAATNVIPSLWSVHDSGKYDIVQLVIDNGYYCGLGYVMSSATTGFAPSAYSTVHWGCMDTSNLAHIHEMGHNFGGLHDRASNTLTTAWPYGYGYRSCPSATAERVKSVMAYWSPNCPGQYNVPVFSTPTRAWSGYAMGDANTDNVRVFKANAVTISNFRQSVTGTTTSLGQCGSANGKQCPTGQCCSQYNWCGTAADWCGTDCQRTYGACW